MANDMIDLKIDLPIFAVIYRNSKNGWKIHSTSFDVEEAFDEFENARSAYGSESVYLAELIFTNGPKTK